MPKTDNKLPQDAVKALDVIGFPGILCDGAEQSATEKS